MLGCEHCEFDDEHDHGQPLGYVVLWAVDDQGMYTYLGRCYYCNHPRR